MVLAEPACPGGDDPRQPLPQGGAPVELDPVTLAIVEPRVSNRSNRSSAQARQVAESWPPENSTSAARSPGPTGSFAIVLRPGHRGLATRTRASPGRSGRNRCQIQAAMFSAVGFSRPSISFEAMVVEPRQQRAEDRLDVVEVDHPAGLRIHRPRATVSSTR